MSRRRSPLWGGLLILVLALAACEPAAPSAGAPGESTAAPTAAQPATAAPTQPPPTEPLPTVAATSEAAAPTAARPTPIPGATSAPAVDPEWQIPMVEEGEWTRGPEDALMTVVEYSDFQ